MRTKKARRKREWIDDDRVFASFLRLSLSLACTYVHSFLSPSFPPLSFGPSLSLKGAPEGNEQHEREREEEEERREREARHYNLIRVVGERGAILKSGSTLGH